MPFLCGEQASACVHACVSARVRECTRGRNTSCNSVECEHVKHRLHSRVRACVTFVGGARMSSHFSTRSRPARNRNSPRDVLNVSRFYGGNNAALETFTTMTQFFFLKQNFRPILDQSRDSRNGSRLFAKERVYVETRDTFWATSIGKYFERNFSYKFLKWKVYAVANYVFGGISTRMKNIREILSANTSFLIRSKDRFTRAQIVA